MESQTHSGGPHLRGSNITLEKITFPTDVETRRTKIVCTLGPACWEVEQLEKLIDAGLSIARFNFSHGDHEGHLACLNRLRTAAQNKNKPVGMFLEFSLIFISLWMDYRRFFVWFEKRVRC
jgi:pyruvate kinase